MLERQLKERIRVDRAPIIENIFLIGCRGVSGGRMKAVILAGGKGTRLADIAAGLPKPLVPVAGRPVLEYQIENLRRFGMTDITLIIGYQGSRIRKHFGDGSRFGVRVEYFEEEQPLGTAGALLCLRESLPERFLVLYGDLMLDIDFRRLIDRHVASAATATLVVHPNNHPADSDIVVVDDAQQVTGILPKNAPRREPYANLVNAGVFLLDREILDGIPAGEVADLESDVIVPAISRGSVYGYRTTEYIRDMGTRHRFEQVGADVRRGVVASRNLARRQRAIFLDRDGTINEFVGLVSRPEQLRIPDEVYSAIADINDSGFLAIVVSNQPVVARNLCTIGDLATITRRMETMLGERGAYVDDIYCCPHHPDAGYPEENPTYKIVCRCRKPGTGMIDEAVERWNIDRSCSFLIGDTTSDVEAARRAGVRSILLATGLAGEDAKYRVTPDLRARDLGAAVRLALDDLSSERRPADLASSARKV
ncbi:HAD-IIIA family hydrolase [Polymorphospora rubra]|uniref:HAD-IIIA family hydrolase n=1 Tax=Polymorphospora rubra TaxID=338584 RepID=UPI0033F020E8